MAKGPPLTKWELDKLIELGSPTKRQAEIITAIHTHGGVVNASRVLGLNSSSVSEKLKVVRGRAAERGFAPSFAMDKPTPEGYHVRGTSTLYDADGVQKLQWVRTQKDKEERDAALRASIEAVFEDYKPLALAEVSPLQGREEILSCLCIGDPHIGMYAWAQETGADFSLSIATEQMQEAVSRLVNSVPHSHECVIINLGDFYHADSVENRTMRSGHALDVDTRYTKVMQVGFETMLRCVELALQRHERVRVINAIGNHDDHASVWLTIAMKAAFAGNERVEVEDTINRFHYVRFGKVLFGVTHGDTVRPEQLPMVMANDRKEDWGKAEYRYWYAGHIHQKRVIEVGGVLIESFRTLAGKDAWAHSRGYRSGREMQAIVLHKEFGEVERHTVSPRMLTQSSNT